MLTKEEVFKICSELWQHMEKIPLEHLKKVKYLPVLKHEWSGWEKYGYMEYDCPCCQYNKENYSDSCFGNCLLKDIWKNGCYVGKGSPYNKIQNIFHELYEEGTFLVEDYRKNCRIIWKECERQLKILKEGTNATT